MRRQRAGAASAAASHQRAAGTVGSAQREVAHRREV